MYSSYFKISLNHFPNYTNNKLKCYNFQKPLEDIMKAHAIFDFLHLLVLTLKSYYVWGMPIYVFIIPLIFVVGYIIINSNKKQKTHLFKVTNLLP